jgi:hypothetical protein
MFSLNREDGSIFVSKLKMVLDLTFKTSALTVTEDFKQTNLNEKGQNELLQKIDIDDIQFEIISTNPSADLSFPASRKNGKKTDIFEVSNRVDGAGLDVKIKGTYSVSLRSGAGEMLAELGETLDLRVRAVIWKGGYYNGFSAYVEGGDHEQKSDNWQETFPKVDQFSIK